MEQQLDPDVSPSSRKPLPPSGKCSAAPSTTPHRCWWGGGRRQGSTPVWWGRAEGRGQLGRAQARPRQPCRRAPALKVSGLAGTGPPLRLHTQPPPARLAHGGRASAPAHPHAPPFQNHLGSRMQRRREQAGRASSPLMPPPCSHKKQELGSQGSRKGQELPVAGGGRDEAAADAVSPHGRDIFLQAVSTSSPCPTAAARLGTHHAREVAAKLDTPPFTPKPQSGRAQPQRPGTSGLGRGWQAAPGSAGRRSPPKPFPRGLLKDTTAHRSLPPPPGRLLLWGGCPGQRVQAKDGDVASRPLPPQSGARKTMQKPRKTTQKPWKTTQKPQKTMQKPQKTTQKPEKTTQKPQRPI